MLRIDAVFWSFNRASDSPKQILTDTSEPDSNQDVGILSITVDISQFLFQLLPRCYPARILLRFGTKEKPTISLKWWFFYWLREPDLN